MTPQAASVGQRTEPYGTSSHAPWRRFLMAAVTRSGLANLCRPLTRGAVVIFMVHRFEDPDRGVVGFSPQTLRTLLAHLRRERYHLVDLATALQRLAGHGEPLERAVAFTIDDGYREHATVAGPAFAEFDCPVTTFATTGFLDHQLWFWWDQIEYIFTNTRRPSVEIEIGGAHRRYELGDPESARAAQADFTNRCKDVPDSAKHSAIRSLAATAEVQLPDRAPPQYSPMSWDELRAAERGGMSFGPHTVTHPILSRADEAQSRYEIEESWRRLRAEASAPVPILAYPNGQPQDFGPREIATMREVGLEGACTGFPGYATPRGYRSPDGPYHLRRFAFPADLAQVTQLVSGLERLKRLIRGVD